MKTLFVVLFLILAAVAPMAQVTVFSTQVDFEVTLQLESGYTAQFLEVVDSYPDDALLPLTTATMLVYALEGAPGGKTKATCRFATPSVRLGRTLELGILSPEGGNTSSQTVANLACHVFWANQYERPIGAKVLFEQKIGRLMVESPDLLFKFVDYPQQEQENDYLLQVNPILQKGGAVRYTLHTGLMLDNEDVKTAFLIDLDAIGRPEQIKISGKSAFYAYKTEGYRYAIDYDEYDRLSAFTVWFADGEALGYGALNQRKARLISNLLKEAQLLETQTRARRYKGEDVKLEMGIDSPYGKALKAWHDVFCAEPGGFDLTK